MKGRPVLHGYYRFALFLCVKLRNFEQWVWLRAGKMTLSENFAQLSYLRENKC